MSEKDMLQQLQELGAKMDRIEKAINALPQLLDEKLRCLNKNQGDIIMLLQKNKGKSMAHTMEAKF